MENKLWKTNKLICGDNLEELAKLPKENVDLIYIDPPFFTHKQYEVVWGDEAEVRSYRDRWEGGVEHYIGWLKPRVQAMYEILKPTGSFYIHCDWHANAHIRIMLDEIFGPENFQNEIVWAYRIQGVGKKRWARKHDSIFFYSKTKNYIFNPQKERLRYKKSFYDAKKDKEGYYRDVYIRDIWDDINALISISKELEGYPTQKPEALLERIIKASSNKSDIVLDAFCGCGTTMAAAQKLGRRWIGIDISPTAIKIIERRLKKNLKTIEGINYEVIGMPTTVEEVKKLEPFEFQNWVVIDKMRANASRKKVGDMGLDGYYPESILTKSAGIQVKQSDGVGRNIVDNFETALKRADYKKGYIVAFSFSKGAYEEVARIKNKEGLEIKLITVKDLLEKKKPII
ncbi:restriction endonuclease [Candidatus Parcubacteria bacterium]|nr:restriction endonuclease [Candidatus Parcubacteria bacterium]